MGDNTYTQPVFDRLDRNTLEKEKFSRRSDGRVQVKTDGQGTGGGGLAAATSEKITNLALTSANTEFSLALQANLKQLIIRNRSMAVTKFAFTATESGTKFITISRGAVATIDKIDFTSKTLYVQANIISTLEILELY